MRATPWPSAVLISACVPPGEVAAERFVAIARGDASGEVELRIVDR
jgi:hypothetical protein